eukprot:scaffold3691_cov394-Prasinococcus_capsulatus_cf.AAC.8
MTDALLSHAFRGYGGVLGPVDAGRSVHRPASGACFVSRGPRGAAIPGRKRHPRPPEQQESG